MARSSMGTGVLSVPLVSPGPRALATFLISAADLLNDRVFPVCDSHEVTLLRVLTGRGSEYCGNPERHECELYLAIENIDHSRSKPRARRHGRPPAFF